MDYSVQSVTEGIEALAITRISLRPTGKLASEGFTTNAQVSPRCSEDTCSKLSL